MSEIKLLPCPFCGREEIEETYYSFMPVLKCKICGAIMTFPASFRGNYRTELARKWNTRKPLQEIVERLEEELKKVQTEYSEAKYLLNEMDEKDRDYISQSYRKDMNEGMYFAYDEAIEIVKEVGGMNE